MTEERPWSVLGSTGKPVRPGDKFVWVSFYGVPGRIEPCEAIRFGEALTIAGSMAISAGTHVDSLDGVVVDDGVTEQEAIS